MFRKVGQENTPPQSHLTISSYHLILPSLISPSPNRPPPKGTMSDANEKQIVFYQNGSLVSNLTIDAPQRDNEQCK